MADPTSDHNDLFAQWRKQMEAGTDAWIRTVRQMASQGHVPPPPDPMQFWRQFSNLGSMNASPFPGAGPVDPQVLAQWKQFLDDWLAAWSRALEQAMGTEAFAEALGKTLDQFLTIQGKARQAAERSGKAAIDVLGLPSREQVVGLSRQLMDLEDRLEGLEDKIESLGSGPPMTDLESRLEGLEDKIDGLRDQPPMTDLEGRLEGLEDKIDGLRDQPPMTDLEGRLEGLEDEMEGLRNSRPAPPTADGSPPERPAGGTEKKAGAAAKKSGAAAARNARGTAKARGAATKSGAAAARTGGAATKTGAGAARARKRRA